MGPFQLTTGIVILVEDGISALATPELPVDALARRLGVILNHVTLQEPWKGFPGFGTLHENDYI